MALEQFINNGTAILDGPINGSQTSFDVADASALPTAGNFRLRIDDELLLCTAVSGDTLTVTRGIEGTSGASHIDGRDVTCIVTAGAWSQRVEDECDVGAYSARPAAGRAGSLWLPTDAPALHRDDGAAWEHYGPLYRLVPPPASSGFSWVNQGGASVVEAAGGITLTDPPHNGLQMRMRVKAQPSTPYTIKAGFTVGCDPATVAATSDGGFKFGVCVRQSSTGEIHAAEFNQHSAIRGWLFHGHKYTDEDTNSGYNSLNTWYGLFGPIFWAYITNDGSSIKGGFSYDGLHWIEHWSEAISFLTPNQVGFFVNNNITSGTPKFDSFARLVSWEQS